MGPAFTDSKRYASLYASPQGPGDARPTALQIVKDNDMIGKLTDKVAFVTGGSNGIGVDEVKNLARTGAKVFFTARDHSKGERVRDEILSSLSKEDLEFEPRVEVVTMDLESFDSVKRAAEDFKSRSKTLNILVNNAGEKYQDIHNTSLALTRSSGIANTPFRLINGLESQFVVCHLSHFLLVELLKPMLLESSTPSFNSRVVVLSSGAHSFNDGIYRDYKFEKREYDAFKAYGQAKTCNIWHANAIERKHGSQGLHGISVHPGGIRTGLQASHDPKAAELIEQILQTPDVQRIMMDVEQGSATAVLASIGKEYEGKGGFYMEDCGISDAMPENAKLAAPGYKPWAYDPENEELLWQDSLELLGLKST